MKRLGSALVVVAVLAAGLLWWFNHDWLGVSVALPGARGSAAVSKATPAPATAPRDDLLQSVVARIRPATASTAGGDARARLQHLDVRQAHLAEHPLAALKALAEKGNAFAANDVGAMLVRCVLANQAWGEGQRYLLREKQKNARFHMDLLQHVPASASSVADARQRLDDLERRIASINTLLDGCKGMALGQAWHGFRWFDRAYRMGYDQAARHFIGSLVGTFRSREIAGRNLPRAYRLRDKALGYLNDMLMQCNASRLGFYATSLPKLRGLSAYQRYMMGQVQTRNPLYAEQPEYRNWLRKKLQLRQLAGTLSAQQQRAARQVARGMWTRCLAR